MAVAADAEPPAWPAVFEFGVVPVDEDVDDEDEDI